MKSIPHPDYLISNPKQGVSELSFAIMTQNKLIETLFSDSRESILANRLEQGLKERVYTMYPKYKNNLEWDILLSVLIQGCFHAVASHSATADINCLIEIIGTINETLLTNYPIR